MNTRKTSFALVLCIGMAAVTAGSVHTFAQDQRPQQGNQQKPGNNGNRPQQNRPPAANRPQTKPVQSRPQTKPAQTRPVQARPPQKRPVQAHPSTKPAPNRPPNRPPQQTRPNYQFRSQDTSRLRQYYKGNLGRVNRSRRAHFSRGGYIPAYYRHYFRPVPPTMIGYLPPVPPGYVLGYYNGYIVVYDPATFLIVSVLNLLQ
ncbi:MAG TPA: hypothetical protein VHX63_06910 [Acidobacteriaceae bacterium]|jgi:hypothetical protein|nr:hypothetical protein [Acidobacteriaceae bacterium]